MKWRIPIDSFTKCCRQIRAATISIPITALQPITGIVNGSQNGIAGTGGAEQGGGLFEMQPVKGITAHIEHRRRSQGGPGFMSRYNAEVGVLLRRGWKPYKRKMCAVGLIY